MISFRAIIYFFVGIPEEISNVSLRRNRLTGVRSVLLSLKQVRALERFNSFTKQFTNSLCLTNEGVARNHTLFCKIYFWRP